MNIVIPQDEEQKLSCGGDQAWSRPDWIPAPEPDENAEQYGNELGGEFGIAERYEKMAADDDLDDFDEDDFDDEFDDDFEEELEDEYELSEFEDVTEDDLVEGDDDLDTTGGDFVDEDAEPEEAPLADQEESAEKEGKEGKDAKGAKPAKDNKKKGKPAKADDEDEDFDDED